MNEFEEIMPQLWGSLEDFSHKHVMLRYLGHESRSADKAGDGDTMKHYATKARDSALKMVEEAPYTAGFFHLAEVALPYIRQR